MKTARFAELVAKAGKPEPHQLWSAPARDPAFRRALQERRVLTIHQENVGTKKDFGVVGFHEEPHAQFVIFPRSIREFEGRRVIGINYDLLAQPAMTWAAAPTSERVKRAANAGRSTLALKPTRPHATPSRREGVSVGAHPDAPSAAAPSVGAKTPKAVDRARRTEPDKKKVRPASTADEVSAKPATPIKSASSLDPHVAREITQAMKELKAGKVVAAYERLQELVGAKL